MVHFVIFGIEEFFVASVRLNCIKENPNIHSEIEAIDDQEENELPS
jgi:hypothetical protein